MKKFFPYLFLIFLLNSCAQIVVPTGGEKDTTPPALINEKSYPRNGAVNFSGQKIVLEFDEFIRMNNPQQNIFISPVPSKQPQYILKGKTLSINFQESLAPNTTYTIQFGNAIVDYTEGNPARDLTYVFSTGPYLDSMKVEGNVINALTNLPEKGIVVMLYEDLSDSAVFKSKPAYFAVTDNSGSYNIKNIRGGKYRIYGLRDLNNNYIYNEEEEIAFRDEAIVLDANTVSQQVKLILFKEKRGKQFVKKIIPTTTGKVTVILNRDVVNPVVELTDDFQKFPVRNISEKYYIKETNQDTLEIFLMYMNAFEKKQELFFVLKDSNALIDTIRFRSPFTNNRKPDTKLNLVTNLKDKFDRTDSVKFYFNTPVVRISSEKIILKKDSVPVAFVNDIQNGSSIYNAFQIPYSFAKDDGSVYQLEVFPGAFSDIYQNTNDTIKFTFTVNRSSFYGVLYYEVVNANNEPLIVQLISDRNFVVKEYSIDRTTELQFHHLRPGGYKVKIIHDENRNGKWDTGNVLQKIQPEKITWFTQPVTIRSNWDLKLGIEIKK